MERKAGAYVGLLVAWGSGFRFGKVGWPVRPHCVRSFGWWGLVALGIVASLANVCPASAQSNNRQARERFDRGAELENQAASLLKAGDRRGAKQRLGEALAAYRRALAEAPSDPDPALRIGTILLFEKRCKEALPVLQRSAWQAFRTRLTVSGLSRDSVEGRPKFRELLLLLGRCRLADGPDELGFKALSVVGPLESDVHFLAGRRYLEAKRYQSALTHLSAYIRDRPNDLKARKAVANLQLRLNRLDEAAATYRFVLRQDQDDLTSLKNLAVVEVRRAKYESAVQMFRRVLRRVPDDVAARFNLGVCLARVQQHDEAVQELKKVIGRKPNMARAWHRLGVSLSALGRAREALNALLTAVRHDPKHAPSHVAIARLHRGTRRYDRCASALRQGLARVPDDTAMQVELGGCLRDGGDAKGGLNIHQEVLRATPTDARVHAEVGYDYRALGRLEEAAVAFRRALDLSKTPEPKVRAALADSTAELGVRALRRNDPKTAIMRLQEAVRTRPDGPVDLANLGLAHLAAGQTSAASKVLRAASRLAPRNPGIMTAMARLQLEQGKPSEAIRTLSRPETKRCATCLRLLGLAQLRASRASEGAESLRQAVVLDPENRRLRFDLARALVRARAFSEAAEILEALPSEGLQVEPRIVRLVYGYAFTRTRNNEAASQFFGEVVASSVQERRMASAIWTRRGQELAERGQLRAAFYAFEKARAFDKNVTTRANVAAIEYQQGQAKRAYRIWRSLAKRHRAAPLYFNIAIYFDDHVGNEAIAYRWYVKNAKHASDAFRPEAQALLQRKEELFGFRP